MNQRPLGYEPNELPSCSTPRYFLSGGGKGIRTPAPISWPVGFQDRSLQPDLGIPPLFFGAPGQTWTGTSYYTRRILSPLRLPIPPLRHIIFLVTRWRFELQTLWLKVKCSTCWATGSHYSILLKWLPRLDSNQWNARVKVLCLTTWLRGILIIQVVERNGFEPLNPKEQIYSLPRLASSLPLHKNGAENRNRTRNLLITSQLLYQLSYFGKNMVGDERLELPTPCL